MKRSRIQFPKLWLALFIAVAVSGCDKAQPDVSACHEISLTGSVTDTGILTTYPEPLQFVDFESKESVVLCSKPDCDHQWHSDEEHCPAFEPHHYPFLYSGELYYFRNDSYWGSDGKPVSTYNLIQSDVSGTNEKTVCSVPGIAIGSYAIYLEKDVLYFSVLETGFEPSGASNDEHKFSLYAFNLTNQEVTSYGALVEGDNASLFIHGVTENQIFYDAYHVKGEWEPGMTSEEYEALLEKDSFVLDLQTKEVRHNDLPEPVLVHDGYYYYNRDNALYSHCLADGKETMIAERMFQTEGRLSCSYADGKLFISECSVAGSSVDTYLRCYDLKSGKLTDMGENNKVCAEILAAYKDEYFLSLSDYKQEESTTKLAYIKKSEYLKGEFDRYILLNQAE
ncbi:hypothetical protein [Bianquea renquensis]|jgi:lipoprotein|uniref:DUF5050 domain-containing protein n=1 Tax=Bianquea renquensis TaxID=2763661 RepID=A0A926HY07_9FIRM|nr:hypothetical protein [Bianquea renquensis]MBC8544337.1 hypothetical protein [Bianquea renquensis]